MGTVHVEEDALVTYFKVTMAGVHLVQLRLESEPQLDLLLVVRSILSVVFVELLTQLLLFSAFSFELLAHFFKSLYVFFEHFLVLLLLAALLIEICLKPLQLGLVLLGDFADQHAVVRTAAVLEQDCEHFPDV